MSRLFRVQQTYSTLLDQQQARGLYGITISVLVLTLLGLPVLMSGVLPDELIRSFIILAYPFESTFSRQPLCQSLPVSWCCTRCVEDS